MTQIERYCPICRTRLAESSCPVHGIPTIAASLLSIPAELAPGTVLAGRYRVGRLLGKGGMGQVYEATQLSMQRTVALKTLHPRLLQDADHLGRFYREAKAASLLEGPNIVRVYDFGVDDATATPFIIMELVRGVTLRARVAAAGVLHPSEAAAISAQVCRALIEAQAAGIVHRDLKSENILLAAGPFGAATVKVMDFGVAKLDRDVHGETGSLTASGAILGTPRTMAPEQILGEPVDTQTDLYSLGCVLHEMLTGAAPFQGDDPIAVINQQLLAAPPPLDPALGVPPALVALRDALLQKERARRPQDLSALARQLEALAGSGDERAGVGNAATAWMTSDTLDEPGARGAPTEVRAVREPPEVGVDAPTMTRTDTPEVSAPRQTGPSRQAWRRAGAVLALAAAIAVALLVAIPDRPTAPGDERGGGEQSAAAVIPSKTEPSGETDEAARLPAPVIDAGVAGRYATALGSAADATESGALDGHPSSGASPQDASKGADTPVPDLPATAEPPAPATATPKPPPARRWVTVDSTPEAQAYQGKKDLGPTPVTVPVPPGSNVTIRLEARGYHTRNVVLDKHTARHHAVKLSQDLSGDRGRVDD